ncbi:MAG: HD domain-containing protein [Clostridia bacterium]|nr:HD domain-containing protein [Clostridia bacterium]
MKQIITNLNQKLTDLFQYENTGHDITHLNRVFENAIKIQKNEGGDLYVIAIAALIHDLHRLMSNQQNHYVKPEDGLYLAKQILLDCNIDIDKMEHILEVVKNHDNKKNKNFSLETLIIQDADALDAVGEIGLQRTLTYCKTHNIPINSPKPLDSCEYIADINPISTCHYIYRTMIPNANNLYTKTAKEMAKNKIKILEDFISENYLPKN